MRVGCIYTVVILNGKLWIDSTLQKRPNRKLMQFMKDENLIRAGVQVLPDGFRVMDRMAKLEPATKGRKKR
jgi:hypothetical protein